MFDKSFPGFFLQIWKFFKIFFVFEKKLPKKTSEKFIAPKKFGDFIHTPKHNP